jgi:hypothetical protein
MKTQADWLSQCQGKSLDYMKLGKDTEEWNGRN